jgi:hypothetical protein
MIPSLRSWNAGVSRQLSARLPFCDGYIHAEDRIPRSTILHGPAGENAYEQRTNFGTQISRDSGQSRACRVRPRRENAAAPPPDWLSGGINCVVAT